MTGPNMESIHSEKFSVKELYAGLALQGIIANSAGQDFLNQKPLSLGTVAEHCELAKAYAEQLFKVMREE